MLREYNEVNTEFSHTIVDLIQGQRATDGRVLINRLDLNERVNMYSLCGYVG